MNGKLIIITSPSGGGKGTIIKEVLTTVPDLAYSVSLTTRAPRPGEAGGREYHFVTLDEFNAFRDQDGFLEYAEVHGNFYGTSRAKIGEHTRSGKDVILEIDVQGAAAVLEKVPESVSIFILPPSYEALAERLRSRNTEDPAQLALRLSNSVTEVRRYEEFEYFVINDNLTDAVDRVRSIILGERQRRARQTESIRAILDSFDASKISSS
jgi:guanylate kinase